LEGRNSNVEHLNRSKERERREEDQDGPDDPGVVLGIIKFESVSLFTIVLSDVRL
jgi:hypothetical protein